MKASQLIRILKEKLTAKYPDIDRAVGRINAEYVDNKRPQFVVHIMGFTSNFDKDYKIYLKANSVKEILGEFEKQLLELDKREVIELE